ncbi:MAG: LysE family translocator, partial [Deltaproteobacteria bacterium]|nr:LysE family translocator [Deltaproteobacteria bacterium]
MNFEAWLLFCMTETVLCLTPGPAVLMVISVSMTLGGASGLRAASGVLAANFLYFALAATGLAAVIAASYEVFSLVKWLGAGYLIWIGAGMICASLRNDTNASSPVATARAIDSRAARAFRHGFVTQAANPKLLIFFAAIVPQLIDPAERIASQMAILGVS